MQTSQGSCLPDLPLSRLDLPQVRPVFSSSNAVGLALQRLAGLRVRVSLCRLWLPCGRLRSLRIAEAIDDPSLIVDVAPDGAVLVLAVGPRAPGPAGDAAMASTIAEKLLSALADSHQGPPIRRARLSVMHGWTDSIDAATMMCSGLAIEPSRTLADVLEIAA